jgi:hypothetical protein
LASSRWQPPSASFVTIELIEPVASIPNAKMKSVASFIASNAPRLQRLQRLQRL